MCVRLLSVTLAAAGHPPPLRIGPHGVRPVNVSGMLLGVVTDFEYQQVTVRLEEDELLVIHSDGIEAAFARNVRPGEAGTRPIPPHFAHLARMRQGEALGSLGAAMDRLVDDLDAQAGSLHQDDDVTVLTFQTTSVREPGTGTAATSQRMNVSVRGVTWPTIALPITQLSDQKSDVRVSSR